LNRGRSYFEHAILFDRRKVIVVLTETGETAMKWCETQWREALQAFENDRLDELAEDIVRLAQSVAARAKSVPAHASRHAAGVRTSR
jgi:hypothetical protein